MNFNKYKTILKQYDVEFNKLKIRKDLKRLLIRKNKSLGRSYGRIVMWHRGGGVKRNFRLLFTNKIFRKNLFLFNYNKNNHKWLSYLNKLDQQKKWEFSKIYAYVRSVEYDPNRSCFIGLVQFKNGDFANIPIASGVKVNTVISFFSEKKKSRKIGDFLKLRYAPIGIPIYNLEKYPGSGAIYSKAAGASAILLTKDLKYGKVKLPSKEERLFNLDCSVTIGIPSNIYNRFNKDYKAGTTRLLNKRPIVRGVAMNPIDHPHGGGAGKTAPGRPSVSPWGKLTKGVPTRNKSIINKFIIKRN